MMTNDHVHTIINNLLSVGIILPVLIFFIQRLIKIRDNNDSVLKDEIKDLTNSLKHLETQVMLLNKDIKNEEFNGRIKDLAKDVRRIDGEMARRSHWITNTFMKIDNRLSKLDNKEIEFEEPPLSGKL